MPQLPKSSNAQEAHDKALESIEECHKKGSKGNSLDLSFLGLTNVPIEIGKLTALTRLNLSHNRLKKLPMEIGQLTALTILDISDNKISGFNFEIGNLSSLKELCALNNNIRKLPNEIGMLRRLRNINLQNNFLSALPSEIGRLSSLKELNLHGNRIGALPVEFVNLKNLTHLYLWNNPLRTFPDEIVHLLKLRTLFIASNQIKALPKEIGNLKELIDLFVWDNLLTSLPSEIGDLTRLERFCAEENNLQDIPKSLTRLTHLEELRLHGNDALSLPAEVLGATRDCRANNVPPTKPTAILDYYFSRQEEGSQPLNEVKLLLVGRGESGKTSISRALRGVPFDREQKETPGIEIEPWEASCPEGKVRVHLWDFAGQEITHETHRFFLSQRSLYLVVLDGRGGQQMEEAEYWLSHVAKYGATKAMEKDAPDEHSPVIVVLNKWKSPGPYDVEKRRLQREYPNIRAFVETDCESNSHGIEDLKETIFCVLKQMPAVRAEWAMSYFNVRDQLEKLGKNKNPKLRKHFLTWKDYRTVCAQCGVLGEQRQASLAENLNALGIALYYGEDERLRDTRVLNPNWAANGLYGLLRGVQRLPHRGQQGQLWAGDFAQVITEGMKGMNPERGAAIDDYPEEKDGVKVHQFLLNLMQDRELGFLAGEERGHALYLLPGLLPLDEPEPQDYDVALHLEGAVLRFRYLYELLPAGVMSRFIVRTHVLSDEYHRWQRGVVIGWGDARALLMAERRRNPRVDVFIRGGTPEERQELAGVVRSNMEEIHRGLPNGLRGREELELRGPDEQFESVEKLERLENEGLAVQVVTATGNEMLDVTPQLEQVQPFNARRKGAPQLRVFVSYAHANYRAWNHLKTHLDVLKNERLVSWWFDGKIRAGAEWDDTIRREMKEADVIVLLLSNAFFASPYIKGVELKAARARLKAGNAEILPVLLEPTEAFAAHKWLKDLQTAPSANGQLRAITTFNPAVNGWNQVQKALRDVIADASVKRPKIDQIS